PVSAADLFQPINPPQSIHLRLTLRYPLPPGPACGRVRAGDPDQPLPFLALPFEADDAGSHAVASDELRGALETCKPGLREHIHAYSIRVQLSSADCHLIAMPQPLPDLIHCPPAFRAHRSPISASSAE